MDRIKAMFVFLSLVIILQVPFLNYGKILTAVHHLAHIVGNMTSYVRKYSNVTSHVNKIYNRIHGHEPRLEGLWNKESRIWYDPEYPDDDRIDAQTKHIPKSYKALLEKGKSPKVKRILRYYGFGGVPFYAGNVKPGRKAFENCSVSHCELSSDKSLMSKMDAVVFEFGYPKRVRNIIANKQIWLLFGLESPHLSHGFRKGSEINWTATYRRDSTFYTPYQKFVPETAPSKNGQTQKNYASGKTKKVAWFVSNCRTPNNRLDYARELAKFIQVEIHGGCGMKGNSCGPHWSGACYEMLRKHFKFYLSFENANCRQYITEKLFLNGLQYDAVPIVMGASPYDYRAVAPPNSYIHTDDFASPRELAEYLHKLDKNDTLYNEYFKWKGTGYKITGLEDFNFWCRFCSLLHEQDNQPHSWYADLNDWWNGKGICIGSDYWRNHPEGNVSLVTARTVKWTG